MDDLDLFMKELQLSGYKVERMTRISPELWAERGMWRKDLIIEVDGGQDIVLGMTGLQSLHRRLQYEVYRTGVDDNPGRYFDKLEDALDCISEMLRDG